MTDEHGIHRRTVLEGTLALGAAASLAGCSSLPVVGDDGGGGGGGDLSYGDEITGELEESDDTDPHRDVVSDSYEFSGSSGDEVVITMESQPLDPYLVLSKDGEIVDEDDDGAETILDSRIETTLPEDGTYTIWASRYDGFLSGTGEDHGEYTLTLEQA